MDDKLLSNLSLSNSIRPQEKVESIEQIIYLLNKYIRDPESLNEVFTTDLTKAVSLILQHPIITGQRGDELASDLIFRVINTHKVTNIIRTRSIRSKSIVCGKSWSM